MKQAKNTLSRRDFMTISLGLAALAMPMLPAHAQHSWPPALVKILVPLGPGGANDVIARMFAQYLQERFPSSSFIVENRVGAGGAVAMEALAKSPADGSIVGMVTTASIAILPALRSNLRYDAAKDLSLVAELCEYPQVLVVNSSVPAKTLAEFVAYAKANPDKLTYGSGGVGTSDHLASETFNSVSGIRTRHVPYKSTSEHVPAVLGGHIDYVTTALTNVAEQIRTGKVRAIAVASAERFPELPDVPAIAESYVGFAPVPWGGIAVPAGTPAAVVNKLSEESRMFLEVPAVKAKLRQLWAAPKWRSVADFREYVRSEQVKYVESINAAGIKVD